jgi:hypothetical protein
VKLEDLEGLQLEVDVAGRLRLAAIAIPTVKGMVRGQAMAITRRSLGEEDGLYRTALWYSKAQTGLTPTSTCKREEEEEEEEEGEKGVLLPCPSWAVQLPIQVMSHVRQSVYARGGIHTTTVLYFASLFVGSLFLQKKRHDGVLCERVGLTRVRRTKIHNIVQRD